MMKLYLIILLFALPFVSSAQQVTLDNPFNMKVDRLKITNLPNGSLSDSVLVKTPEWIGKVAIPVVPIINTTTVGLSKSALNTAYPNVPIGTRVLCPNITLGGAIYTKATENGTNDVWQLTSAPPVL